MQSEKINEKAQHTPGPWEVLQLNHAHGDYWAMVGHMGMGHVNVTHIRPAAQMKYFCIPEEEQRANAQLIAAAPEMLAVLKKLTADIDLEELCGSYHKDWQEAIRVIAKAEGRDG